MTPQPGETGTFNLNLIAKDQYVKHEELYPNLTHIHRQK